MRNEPIYTPPGGPPQGQGPSRELYAAMGEEAIFRLARDFYAALEASEIRGLFPEDMPKASRKLAQFLTPLFGGPPLYQREHGPPRMRARHIPFVIGVKERAVWLACFFQVLDKGDYGIPPQHLPGLKEFLEGFSAWMVNYKAD